MQKIKICALMLLALCLAVSVVSAENVITLSHTSGTQTFNLGSISDLSVRFASGESGFNVVVYGFSSGEYIDGVFTLSSNYNRVDGQYRFYPIGGNPGSPSATGYIIINYNYVEPTPEPTPQPAAYLTATVLSESTTGVTYEIRPMPDDGSYSFSYISVGSHPNYGGIGNPYMNPSYSSDEVSIRYKIGYGDSATFNCLALTGFYDLQFINITVTVPINEGDLFINSSVINETLQNMPNPINPSPSANNAFVSGAWSPMGRDAVISSAFGDIVRNGGIIFSLPHMASPEELRASLLNNTGNITEPLYDFIDSASGMVLFLPDILGNAVGTVLNGFSETVSIIKVYIDYLFGLLDNCMDFIYILLPVIYVLIPDVVWWCFTALLCYYIIKWILILILGYDVVSAYLTDSQKGDD